MLAMPLEEELQLTVEVMSFDVPLLYFPIAVNCCVDPNAIVDPDGVTAIDVKVPFGGGGVLVELPPQLTKLEISSTATNNDPNLTHMLGLLRMDSGNTTTGRERLQMTYSSFRAKPRTSYS